MLQFRQRTNGFTSPICDHVVLNHGKSDTTHQEQRQSSHHSSQEENRGPEFICKSALEVDFS